jgi:superfamily II DNA or RNA helicase
MTPTTEVKTEKIILDREVPTPLLIPNEVHGPLVELEDRDYQNRIIAKTMEAIEEGHRNIMIELATGAGKTIIAFKIAAECYNRYGWKFGWTCMRRALLHQAAMVNRDMFGYGFGHFFSTFSTHLDELPAFDLLIEDEAQHSASDTSTTLYNRLQPRVHLALTATPYRTDRVKLCFSKVIKDAGIRQLVDSGHLSPYHSYIVPDIWKPENVANLYLREPERWGKSLIFFLTLKQCYECEAYLKAAGIRCAVVEGGSPKVQESLIEQFYENKLDVLINVFVLTEGFDAPDLRTVFVRPGSKGPTVQMAGRAFRKHPDKKFAQVVQNQDTNVPFSRIASPEIKFDWDEARQTWKSIKEQRNKLLHVQMKARQAIIHSNCDMPEYIKKRTHNGFANPRWARGDSTNAREARMNMTIQEQGIVNVSTTGSQ